MAELIKLSCYCDSRGALSVVEDFQLPFVIKRFFYIYNVDNSMRGGHRHKITHQAAICLKGACHIYWNDGNGRHQTLQLNSPEQCLLLAPRDWHVMFDFTPDAILLIAASTNFNENDYIFEKYEGDTFF